jgi:hypothetical protein
MKHDSPKLPVKRILALPTDLAKQISDYRYGQRIPSESAATRQLIEIGLAAASQPQEAQR